MDLAARARAARLSRNLTQEEVAERAGVSLSSLKRFERTGLAALDLVVRIALIFDSEDSIEAVFREDVPARLEDLTPSPTRQRARRRKSK